MQIELSPHAQQIFKNRAQIELQSLQSPSVNQAGSGSKVQLDMGNVPVLDQGGYGSCVTFANTAALDAALNQGDYISQVCLFR